jgi:hypothetical protein
MAVKNWYVKSRELIEERYGDDADLFCDILAATSPRKQVRANWNLAVRVYNQYKKDGTYSTTGMMPAHILNTERALKGEPLHGYKVPAFAANLKGDLDRVTIDVWVMMYFGLTQGRIRRAEYFRMEAALQKMARRRGLRPAEHQAKIWCEAVERAGRTPISYADCVGGAF